MTAMIPARPCPWSTLIEDHLPLVEEALRRLGRRLPSHVDRDDLAGAGRVALVQAARQFDPERGTFAAFASRRLAGAMLDELRRSDWASRSVRQEGRRHRAGAEALSARMGRTPTRAEIADVVGTTSDDLRRHEAEAHRATVGSLEAMVEKLGEPVGDAAGPGDALLELERRERLREAVAALPGRTAYALRGRYLEERPIRDLAGDLGVSESRVSQMCSAGLASLRASLEPYLAG